uniref:Uncharacterized protein n=1 Tax=Anguilla anguilla TaxID=7936 RepID=A0A0E9UY66_ANGAN
MFLVILLTGKVITYCKTKQHYTSSP